LAKDTASESSSGTTEGPESGAYPESFFTLFFVFQRVYVCILHDLPMYWLINIDIILPLIQQRRHTGFHRLHNVRCNISGSGVNGSVTLGDGLTQRPDGILGDRSHPVGSRGEDPIGGLVDEPPC